MPQRKPFFIGKAPPKVGRRYWVSCVRYYHKIHSAAFITPITKVLWVPIHGGFHADPEIDNPHRHLHFDIRFISDRFLAFIMGHPWGQGNIPVISKGLDETPCLFFRVKTCFRPAQELEIGINCRFGSKLIDLYSKSSIVVKDECRFCPHKGMPLDSAPIVNGVITCPGHGLKWHKKSGVLAVQEMGISK